MAEGGRDRHECAICLNNFSTPKILPCFHTYCQGCLDEYIRTNSQFNKFNCPVCRKPTSIPQGGAKGFTNNFYLDESGLEKKEYCSKHKEEMKFYCRECCIALCHSCCVIPAHKHHTTVDIADVDQEIRTKIRYNKCEMEETIQTIKHSLEWLQLNCNDMIKSAATARKNVDTQIDNMCTELKKHGKQMNEQINGIQSAGQNKFKIYKKTMTNVLRQLETGVLVDCIDDMLTGKSTKALIDISAPIENLIKNSKTLYSTNVPVIKHPCFQSSLITPFNKCMLSLPLAKVQTMDRPTFTARFDLQEIKKKDGTVFSNNIMIYGLPMCIGVKHCYNSRPTSTGQAAIEVYLYVNNKTYNKYSVDFTLKLQHQTDDKKSIVRESNFLFEGNKFNGGGLSNFITLPKLNGFLDNNQFTIQATVRKCKTNNESFLRLLLCLLLFFSIYFFVL